MKAILQENKIIGTYSPDEAVFIGNAAAKYSKRIAIGRNGESRAAEMALSAGIIAEGSDVISLGKCLETELFFTSRLTSCDLCLYIKEEPLMKIEVRTKGGLPIDKQCMEIINNALRERRVPELLSTEGTVTDSRGFKEVYRRHIEGLLPSKCPYSIYISKSGKNGQKIHFPKTEGEELIIQLSADGTKASLYSDKSGFISYETLIFICCLDMFENGKDAAIPFEFPFAADNLASKYGCKVYRYYSSPQNGCDEIARKLAREQNFTLDGLYLALKSIKIAIEKDLNLTEIKKLIPEFYTAKKFVELDKDRINKILNHWEGNVTPGGTTFAKRESRIIMQPSSSGKGLWLQIESRSMEAAEELCGKIEDKLKKDNF